MLESPVTPVPGASSWRGEFVSEQRRVKRVVRFDKNALGKGSKNIEKSDENSTQKRNEKKRK